MTITNKLTDINDIKKAIKYKVIKASNNNGLKLTILNIIENEQNSREFNKYETLNAINAIPRTQLYFNSNPYPAVNSADAPTYKYSLYRIVEENGYRTYKIKYKPEMMTIYI